MTAHVADQRTQPGADVASELLADLMKTIAHDFRSPLSTLTLSVEMLLEQLPTQPSGASAVMRDSLSRGIEDFARLLDAVQTISRAQRRELHTERIAVRDLLIGHRVRRVDGSLAAALVIADPVPLGDAFEATVDEPLDIELRRAGAMICLTWPLPSQFAALEGSPLAAFVSSIHTYAGTTITRLAAVEVQLQRQDGQLSLSSGRINVCLPSAERPSE